MHDRTIGIDMAAQPKDTACCEIRWGGLGGVVHEFSAASGVDDGRLVELLTDRGARIGIDVPLGWPTEFVEAVRRYGRGEAWGVPASERPRLRRTDLFVNDRLRSDGATKALWPLSVAADRIGVPAMRTAAAMSLAGLSAMARDGSGPVVEVYPAAALAQWGLPCSGYKGKHAEERRSLVRCLVAALDCAVTLSADQIQRVEASDNCLDALIAALIVRCHELGLTYPVPTESADAARFEGWITVPRPGSLITLKNAPIDRPD